MRLPTRAGDATHALPTSIDCRHVRSMATVMAAPVRCVWAKVNLDMVPLRVGRSIDEVPGARNVPPGTNRLFLSSVRKSRGNNGRYRDVSTRVPRPRRRMKTLIHPASEPAAVTCATCGAVIATHWAAGDLTVDTCSRCHPAYTGRAARVTGGSRIERFERRRAR